MTKIDFDLILIDIVVVVVIVIVDCYNYTIICNYWELFKVDLKALILAGSTWKQNGRTLYKDSHLAVSSLDN